MSIGWSSSQFAAAARRGGGTAAGQRQRVITETCSRINRAETGQKTSGKMHHDKRSNDAADHVSC